MRVAALSCMGATALACASRLSLRACERRRRDMRVRVRAACHGGACACVAACAIKHARHVMCNAACNAQCQSVCLMCMCHGAACTQQVGICAPHGRSYMHFSAVRTCVTMPYVTCSIHGASMQHLHCCAFACSMLQEHCIIIAVHADRMRGRTGQCPAARESAARGADMCAA